jgi:chorismate synthase
MKLEKDAVELIAGVLDGKTTGAPIGFSIKNLDHENWKGKAIEPMTIPRPGHADLTAATKYGYPDLRFSLERASARETAARTAVGAICRKLLAQFDIQVGSYVTRIGAVSANLAEMSLEARLQASEANSLRCPDPESLAAMEVEIRETMLAKDTVGGVFEVVAIGIPIGLGSHVHWERRLSTELAAAIMSIPAIKGVENGKGFGYSEIDGTKAHDPIDLSQGKLTRPSNHAGGLEGGISNGQPIIMRAVMKPLSTTLKPQRSVDIAEGSQTETQYERSDFCAVPRAAVVAEAMVCFTLANALLRKLGGDTLREMKERFAALPEASLDELELRDEPITFWP